MIFKSIRLPLFASISLSLIALVCFNIFLPMLEIPRNTETQFLAQDIFPIEKEFLYKFINPRLAYKALTALESNKIPVVPKMGDDLGLIYTKDYCSKRRAYFVQNSEAFFDKMDFVANTKHGSLVRGRIIPSLGRDIHPEVGPHMSAKMAKNPDNPLKNETDLFYTTSGIFGRMVIGQHYSCLSQISNHILGNHLLMTKDLIAKAARDYGKQYENRTQCFDSNKIFPKTWVLYNKEDCEDFFKALNSPEYQELKKERGIVYIRKVARGSHRAEGVEPVHEKVEAKLRLKYDNGSLCGIEKAKFIVQHYVHNPLLLNGYKFDFRMYMLIASTNPLIVYYHDGYLRVTLAEYNANSTDKKVLLTNLALSNQMYKKALKKDQGISKEDLRHAQQWSFERLQDYLLEKGIISDPNWLDNYLRPEFKKAMVHLIRMTQKPFYRHSSLYELHGVDFMLDSDLNLWFVESNESPAIGEYSSTIDKLIVKMVEDHFKIVFGLLRSRMKRAIEYVNVLIKTGHVKEAEMGKISVVNLGEKRETFAKISKNYFEKEFEPTPDNGFVLIIDENLQGVERYQGIVSEECL